jgi:hypothetical protein
MNNQQQPDFVFNLAIPVFKPSEQEIEVMSDPRNIEPFFAQLLQQGYLTPEELAAFVRFALQVSGVTPFLLDEFLNTYRQHETEVSKSKVDILKPSGPKIIIPN